MGREAQIRRNLTEIAQKFRIGRHRVLAIEDLCNCLEKCTAFVCRNSAQHFGDRLEP